MSLKLGTLVEIPFVHDLSADYAPSDIAVALGKSRIRHSIEGSAMGAKEAPAFRDCAC